MKSTPKKSKASTAATRKGRVQRVVRPPTIKVTYAEWKKLGRLKTPADAADYVAILGQARAAVVLSASFHDKTTVVLVA